MEAPGKFRTSIKVDERNSAGSSHFLQQTAGSPAGVSQGHPSQGPDLAKRRTAGGEFSAGTAPPWMGAENWAQGASRGGEGLGWWGSGLGEGGRLLGWVGAACGETSLSIRQREPARSLEAKHHPGVG